MFTDCWFFVLSIRRLSQIPSKTIRRTRSSSKNSPHFGLPFYCFRPNLILIHLDTDVPKLTFLPTTCSSGSISSTQTTPSRKRWGFLSAANNELKTSERFCLGLIVCITDCRLLFIRPVRGALTSGVLGRGRGFISSPMRWTQPLSPAEASAPGWTRWSVSLFAGCMICMVSPALLA